MEAQISVMQLPIQLQRPSKVTTKNSGSLTSIVVASDGNRDDSHLGAVDARLDGRIGISCRRLLGVPQRAGRS